MKQIKRLGALIVSFAIVLSIIVPASAVSTNDSTVFLKQNTGSTCTLSAAAMMLRRRAILDGSSNWTSITESNLKPTAWVTGEGARFNYTYNGVSVTAKSLKNFSGDKKEYFISMLSAHPEGIVVYNHSKPHAVLLTDYDVTTDTFYCADPSTAAPNGRIKFLNSRIPGDTQDSKIANINQIWYVKSGKTISPITVKISQSGHWAVSIPSHYKLLCYSSADATKNSTYIKAQSGTYVLSCTKTVTLSNGKTRYFFVSGDKKSLWFDYDANYMSVTESQGETSQKLYTVYFDPNGGIVSQSSKTVTAGSVVGSMPTPTREGYTFLGWINSQGGSAGLLLRTGDEMFVEKDITLYAAWKEIQAPSKNYEVILDNGSTCKTITVTNGGTYGSLPTPSRDGYTFDGWYTQASGGSKITAATKVNLTSSQTLYAHWIQNAVHKHEKINPTVSPEHPHYTFYTCSCGEVFTDNVENSVDSCLVCALGQLGDDMINSAIPEPPKGYWSTWSNWSTASASVSDTRQVETRTITEQVKISDGYTEYRYGGYATSDGRHECWCETYLRNKFGSSNIRYTDWNTTRYKVNGTSWTCGNCSGNHVYVDHYGNDGRAWWPEYTLPNGKNYYWEESRTVDAQYETRKVTQYRYRDWVAG